MNSPKDFSLRIVTPDFDSPLTDDIVELEKLRKKYLSGSTPPHIFFQLKRIFHLLESWASARIEGNFTTILELVDKKSENKPLDTDERFKEIANVESALDFIDENIDGTNISPAFIRELHKKVVNGLSKEGDSSPGVYRQQNVSISHSPHKPPDYTRVQFYMDELIHFINNDVLPKCGLLKIAIAHHRFSWIHPFRNGNGRTVRLLTYAMLIKQKFDVKKGGRILNPTAVFCNDRHQYYHYLSIADRGNNEDILQWCEYVVKGLKDEMLKIDNLLDFNFLKPKILIPAIDLCTENKIISRDESIILKVALDNIPVMSKDVKTKFAKKTDYQITYMFRTLKEKRMLVPENPKSRKYFVQFTNNDLLRYVIAKLNEHHFLPTLLENQ